MPYYVYRVSRRPILTLERVDSLPTFAGASARAKAARLDSALPEGVSIRVIFAATELDAEALLSEVRENAPGPGDEP